MQEYFHRLALIAPLLFIMCQPPASSNLTHHAILNQLEATCSNPGDFGTASFATDPQAHQMVLQLTGTGASVESGVTNFVATTFQRVEVTFNGDCSESLLPASLIVRIKFIKPGTTAVLDHGYDCARNSVGVLPDGRTDVVITTKSLCDCHDMIPPGSQLLSVALNLTCSDSNTGNIHKEMIYSLNVNEHPVPFDTSAPSASCSSE